MAVMFQSVENLAVVGMDAAWAGVDGLDACERMIYESGQQFARLVDGKPAWSVEPGARLIERSARRALIDAGPGLVQEDGDLLLIVAGSNLAGFSWPGPWRDLSGEVNPLAAALRTAQDWITGGPGRAVIFAAASGIPETPAGDVFAPAESRAMGFDREAHGWRLGEGAGAVVWMNAVRAASENYRTYAVVRAGASSPGRTIQNTWPGMPVPPALEDVRGCCQAALAAAGVQTGQVGYLEAFASGVDALDGVEIAGLAQAFRTGEAGLSTALGSAQANWGYLGAASGLASLIRAALCLYHRMIPAVPGWTAPKLPALWRGTPFYLPTESRAWFACDRAPGRVAAVNAVGLNGSFTHLVLTEGNRGDLHPNRALEQGGLYLVPLVGDDPDELNAQLADLHQALLYTANLPALAAEAHAALQARGDAGCAVSLVGRSHEEILREVDLAITAIPGAVEKRTEWQTPSGSCFTPEPVGRLGEVALVYPGAFNSYPCAAKDLFRLFPWLHLKSVGRTTDLGHVIREEQLYPRTLMAPTKEDQADHEARLLADPLAMLTSGTTLAILFTYLLEEGFRIHPVAAFGYSLGENSMLFASGVWQEGDAVTARLEASPIFRSRLAGPQNAVREAWGLPNEETGDPQNPLWSNYLVMASFENVASQLQHEPRVYVTHINTPRQVVIGGDPAACQRVIRALRCASIQAPFDYALHCAPMASEEPGLADIHHWPVECQPNLRMYTAAGYEPLGLDQDEIAQKVARMLCSPLDFPRLIRRVYADGARVFIETGAGGNCARWIDETLKGSPHLALSINRRGTDDYTNLIRMAARLHAHRVPMDLSVLYSLALQKVSE